MSFAIMGAGTAFSNRLASNSNQSLVVSAYGDKRPTGVYREWKKDTPVPCNGIASTKLDVYKNHDSNPVYLYSVRINTPVAVYELDYSNPRTPWAKVSYANGGQWVKVSQLGLGPCPEEEAIEKARMLDFVSKSKADTITSKTHMICKSVKVDGTLFKGNKVETYEYETMRSDNFNNVISDRIKIYVDGKLNVTIYNTKSVIYNEGKLINISYE